MINDMRFQSVFMSTTTLFGGIDVMSVTDLLIGA